MRDFLNGKNNNITSINKDWPLNTPGGLGKEIQGNMLGMNILSCLENDYRGKMTDGQKFKDSRIETNIVMVTSSQSF